MINKTLYTSNSEEWATPQDLFDKLNDEFKFDLDIAANDNNYKCERYYTKETDALAHKNEWQGNIWCNPPYGRKIGEWVKACAEYSGLSVMLIPARTDTKYFHTYIYKKPNVEIRFLQGRLHFNNSKNAAPFPSMIVVFNNEKH